MGETAQTTDLPGRGSKLEKCSSAGSNLASQQGARKGMGPDGKRRGCPSMHAAATPLGTVGIRDLNERNL